ncbi:MAG: ABC transporter substrate-binding protein [Candidatus Rokubacteria bacterium]|nr:ABC transporter substrate-binding protein [Candidatus Rokubacteria bacterium]
MSVSRAAAVVVAVLLVQLVLASEVLGGVLTDQIRARVDEMYRLVRAPAVSEAPRGDRRAAVRKVADEMFDWAEMARSSLGRHWQARTPEERTKYVRLFADLFEDAYLSKIQLADAEKFRYLGDAVDGDDALVRTKVVTKSGSEIDVDYRLRRHEGDRWKVSDLIVESVSLVDNYRAQFNVVIVRSSFQELINQMKVVQQKRGTMPRS